METKQKSFMKPVIYWLDVIKSWFDIRKKTISSIAFALNRLTGIGLVAYLFLHLAVLSLLLQGEEGWNMFIEIASTPLFLIFDVVLLFGILFHGMNGIRITLIGMGIGTHFQKVFLLFIILVVLIVLIYSTWLIFTI